MKFYKSLDDMPAYNWLKCIESQEYGYCVNPPKKELTQDQLNECKAAFGTLYEQYVDKYGVSEQLQEVLSLKNQIMVHDIDIALTGDRSIKMFKRIKEIELEKLLETSNAKQVNIKVAIEKNLGFRINLKEISVIEYYDYIDELKQNKAA